MARRWRASTGPGRTFGAAAPSRSISTIADGRAIDHRDVEAAGERRRHLAADGLLLQSRRRRDCARHHGHRAVVVLSSARARNASDDRRLPSLHRRQEHRGCARLAWTRVQCRRRGGVRRIRCDIRQVAIGGIFPTTRIISHGSIVAPTSCMSGTSLQIALPAPRLPERSRSARASVIITVALHALAAAALASIAVSPPASQAQLEPTPAAPEPMQLPRMVFLQRPDRVAAEEAAETGNPHLRRVPRTSAAIA